MHEPSLDDLIANFREAMRALFDAFPEMASQEFTDEDKAALDALNSPKD